MIKNSLQSIQPEPSSLNGIYRGVVEDNKNDPEKAGRVKVRVFGIHTEKKEKSDTEGIPTEELPGAEPALSLFEGSVSGKGAFTVPLQGSHVFLFFENGNPMKPIYFASAPGIPEEKADKKKGFNDPAGEFPLRTRIKEPDFDRLSRNKIEDTVIEKRNKNKLTEDILYPSKEDGEFETKNWNEQESYYNAIYPHNVVVSSHGNLVLEMDSTPGNRRFNLYHPSNTYFEINEQGLITTRNTHNKMSIVDKNELRYVKENDHLTVGIDKKKYVKNNETNWIGNDSDTLIQNNSTRVIQNNEDVVIDNNYTKAVNNNYDVKVTNETRFESKGSFQINSPIININNLPIYIGETQRLQDIPTYNPNSSSPGGFGVTTTTQTAANNKVFPLNDNTEYAMFSTFPQLNSQWNTGYTSDNKFYIAKFPGTVSTGALDLNIKGKWSPSLTNSAKGIYFSDVYDWKSNPMVTRINWEQIRLKLTQEQSTYYNTDNLKDSCFFYRYFDGEEKYFIRNDADQSNASAFSILSKSVNFQNDVGGTGAQWGFNSLGGQSYYELFKTIDEVNDLYDGDLNNEIIPTKTITLTTFNSNQTSKSQADYFVTLDKNNYFSMHDEEKNGITGFFNINTPSNLTTYRNIENAYSLPSIQIGSPDDRIHPQKRERFKVFIPAGAYMLTLLLRCSRDTDVRTVCQFNEIPSGEHASKSLSETPFTQSGSFLFNKFEEETYFENAGGTINMYDFVMKTPDTDGTAKYWNTPGWLYTSCYKANYAISIVQCSMVVDLTLYTNWYNSYDKVKDEFGLLK